MQAICNCRILPATVGVGRLPSWCHNSGKDSITVNLSFRFEESKQYQSYPACLPNTLERRAVLSEGTLYFAQTTDRISKKQQTALYATMFVNSLGRDRTLPLSYLYFLLHTVLNKIQYRIHRKYYPEQYLFEIRYHQTVLHASLMELFGWGGDKPRQCLRIGLQSHLRALQKHMVSCQTAPGTLIVICKHAADFPF